MKIIDLFYGISFIEYKIQFKTKLYKNKSNLLTKIKGVKITFNTLKCNESIDIAKGYYDNEGNLIEYSHFLVISTKSNSEHFYLSKHKYAGDYHKT